MYAITGVDRATVEEAYRKAISLGEDSAKQTRSGYALADLGGYYAALGMARQSEPLLKQAAALVPGSAEVLYEVATGYELLGKREQALLSIGKAIAAGISPKFLAQMPQLSALRSDPRYKKAVDLAVQNK